MGVQTRNSGSLKRWEGLVDPGQSKNKVMQRHENFLSNREKVCALLVAAGRQGAREVGKLARREDGIFQVRQHVQAIVSSCAHTKDAA